MHSRFLSVRDRITDLLILLVITVCGLICLLPILNTLAISLSSSAAAGSGTVSFWPKQFTTAAYRYILGEKQLYRSFFNSLRRVVIGGGLNFVLTVLAAFPLSHSSRSFRGRDVYMFFFIFAMLFSGGLIPTYLVVSGLGLINTVWALVLPGAVPIWNCIILVNFFRNLPKELEEVSYIDGAQPVQVLWHVYIPVSLPSLATVTLFSVVGHWNDWFSGLIYVNHTSNYPLATYIQALVNAAKDLSTITDPNELERLIQTSDATVNCAKIFVSMIPILIVYPFMQKYFVTGLVVGSVKE